ncbi:hypothetical protein [Rhodococcus erythropolis]|uniref:hypothetical protein n=1 Tax=Rhodococcus erythropolis TaxID=1833 RepID=UPI000AF0DCF1|nr:hypothetical protein [Rhodococcus erythropolis]
MSTPQANSTGVETPTADDAMSILVQLGINTPEKFQVALDHFHRSELGNLIVRHLESQVPMLLSPNVRGLVQIDRLVDEIFEFTAGVNR